MKIDSSLNSGGKDQHSPISQEIDANGQQRCDTHHGREYLQEGQQGTVASSQEPISESETEKLGLLFGKRFTKADLILTC